MSGNTLEGALSVRDAARLLGYHPETIRRAIRRGDLKACRFGLREFRISRVDLDAYFRAQGGGSLFEGTGAGSQTS